jgi:uncharacterized membrane protein SpoIIM required for sporulation/uncharacterized RDD family membrane protein YckC
MNSAERHSPLQTSVVTSQRLDLTLRTAGVGTRALAWGIDAGLMFAGLLVLFFVLSLAIDPIEFAQGLSTALRTAGALVVFFVVWIYWTFCELKFNGQTLGKRAMKIRVVRSDLAPLRFVDSATRNLLRAIDFFPLCYPLGLICMLIDKKQRRLGDLVAGTVLIVVEDFSHAFAAPKSDRAQLFATARQPRWTKLVSLLDALETRKLSIDELVQFDSLVRQTSNDLAIASRDMPGSHTHAVLADVCGRAQRFVVAATFQRKKKWYQFFVQDFPNAVRDTWPFTLTAFALLSIGATLGALAVLADIEGVGLFVDVNLRSFIERRELWTDSVLQQATPTELAISIFTNNVSVAFRAFAFGLSFGIFSCVVLLWNGVHIGALLASCYQHQLLTPLLIFMAAHGPIELSIIALCGGAGLSMGNALINPKDMTRLQALKTQSKSAVTVVVGCVPFLATVGIIEAFVSPGPFFPWPIKVVFGITSAVAFWMFLLFSQRKHQ